MPRRLFPARRNLAAAWGGLALAALALASPAAAFETRAKAAWVYDTSASVVLLAKDAERAVPPASMSKLMTLFMLFEALRDGRVSMDTEFTVSTKAKNMGGSTMFLNERDRPTVRELILGIIVNSGNDACVVVAEGLAGSEEAFSRQMTERARQLGMNATTLANASGWPHPEHRMSMADLGILARRIIEDFPEYYVYFNEREYDYKGRSPANRLNRNPLFRLNIGADGLKTGHTSEAGFGLVGSAVQGNRRVIFAITGLETEAARAQESEAIVNWAFRQFSEQRLFEAGQVVTQAGVWLGAAQQIDLVISQDLTILRPAAPGAEVTARAIWSGPVEAPVAAGQVLGELHVTTTGMPDRRVPLVAGQDVARAGVLSRLGTAARVLSARALERLAF
jgi:D-alanyl-D-alanine carboxypeptidase (penicillin-binding protein 5/6)